MLIVCEQLLQMLFTVMWRLTRRKQRICIMQLRNMQVFADDYHGLITSEAFNGYSLINFFQSCYLIVEWMIVEPCPNCYMTWPQICRIYCD